MFYALAMRSVFSLDTNDDFIFMGGLVQLKWIILEVSKTNRWTKTVSSDISLYTDHLVCIEVKRINRDKWFYMCALFTQPSKSDHALLSWVSSVNMFAFQTSAKGGDGAQQLVAIKPLIDKVCTYSRSPLAWLQRVWGFVWPTKPLVWG